MAGNTSLELKGDGFMGVARLFSHKGKETASSNIVSLGNGIPLCIRGEDFKTECCCAYRTLA